MTIDFANVQQYFIALQNNIITALEELDGGQFIRDEWQRPEGGSGITRLIENGKVFERGGCNYSHVLGTQLPASASANHPQLAGRSYQAMGVSLVLHPRNPYCPTVHLNVRLFTTISTTNEEDVWWFGGGMDLTPYYPFREDVVHFHQHCKTAILPWGESEYKRLKAWCDRYFYLKHRQEARGVGGLFFDDLGATDDYSFSDAFRLTKNVGDAFLPAYLPIITRRKDLPYFERERDFQSYRRARYVEFNLVFDRGTLFGLQSGGRTESILMSMPPQANWRYNWQPQTGSAEARLYEEFLPAQDWV